MRTPSLLVIPLLSLLGACGDDEGGGGTADARTDSAAAADARADGAGSSDGAGADGAGVDAPPAAPVITRVAWTHETGCVANVAGDVTVVTTVTDADTPAGSLIFTGSVSGCTGSIDAATVTLTCPNVAPYDGTVTVTDPEANSDTQGITIAPCADGMAP